jgi:hypothetical protein
MNGNQILQLGGDAVRGGARIAGRLGARVAGETFGLVTRARHIRSSPKRDMDESSAKPDIGDSSPKPDMDDVTLARKVETEIFRDGKSLKGAVDVNAVDGVVWLRGEVKHPDEVRELEQQVRAIPEVRDVENLLHLPKTPAPTRADTPRRQQRTRSSTRRPTPRTRATGRITDDRTDAIERSAEPSPAQHADGQEGRTAAPMGSQGEGATPPQLEAPDGGGGAT